MQAIFSILILCFSICGYANTVYAEPGITAQIPPNDPVSVSSELDKTVSNSGKRLDIHIIASLDDMVSGEFKIEFREIVNAGDNREYTIQRLDSNLDSFITPYVETPLGTYQFGSSGQTLVFSFSINGEARYGYVVKPTAGVVGSGFCNKDIGILAMYGSFPNFEGYLTNTFSQVYITFDVPIDMPVYAPWTRISDHVYRIVADGIAQFLFVAAWGNFSSVEMRQYGESNEHVLYMLGYGTDAKYTFGFTGFTYDYFMKAFRENIKFLPPSNLAIVLPEGNYDYTPMGEGPGGYYSPNGIVDTLNAKIDHNAGYTACGYKYFTYIINGNDLTTASVHMSAHASIVSFLNDWWSSEGIAVYYQLDMLRRKGIITDTMMKKEFAAHLKYHQDNISGTSNDHALKGFGSTDSCTNFRIAYIIRCTHFLCLK